MLNRFILGLMAIGMSTLVISCGKPDTMGKQSSQREDFKSELPGTWVTKCAGKKIGRVTFAAEKMTVERTTYLDVDCENAIRTTKHSGVFKLANNYKDGVNNSIVLSLDQEIQVTLHLDADVDSANSIISAIQASNETPPPPTQDKQKRIDDERKNLQIRAGKLITSWKKDVEKTLNRLQVEKVNAPFAGIAFEALAPLNEYGRISLKYELDNGFLQMSVSDLGPVFSKQE